MQRRTALTLPALAAATFLGAGCRAPDCLEGGACEETAPCAALALTCDAPSLWIGQVEDALGGVRLARAEATAGDLLLRNDRVTLVLDALAEPHDLAPTGGNVIDFGPNDGGAAGHLVSQ